MLENLFSKKWSISELINFLINFSPRKTALTARLDSVKQNITYYLFIYFFTDICYFSYQPYYYTIRLLMAILLGCGLKSNRTKNGHLTYFILAQNCFKEQYLKRGLRLVTIQYTKYITINNRL